MTDIYLFPFEQYWWFYLAFIAFVLLLIALDLGVFHKEAHAVSIREAAIWSIVWIALALLFNLALYYYLLFHLPNDPRLAAIPNFDFHAVAKKTALEFLSGYLVEKSLSVDNLFVFLVIFSYFQIPNKYQHRVLFYGILGALICRSVFIAAGSILMQFHIVVFLFGVFLIVTGIRMMFPHDEEVNLEDKLAIKLLRRFLPVTSELNGQKMIIKKDARFYATPLLVGLVAIEASDIVFAFDSVPAIFALTKEPMIVFSSNIFAILGLRALYFLLSAILSKFWLLKYGLGFVLVFVGFKMTWLDSVYDGEFPITWSLGIIAGVIFVSVVLSWLVPTTKK